MAKGLIATATISIAAGPDRVWQALVDPEQIRQYLFGTQVASGWTVGSPITYWGSWEGKTYKDKGTILVMEPGKRFVSTYWSSMAGKEDVPENYVTVSYELAVDGDGTAVTLTQDGNDTEESRDHSASNWAMVLAALKKLLEG